MNEFQQLSNLAYKAGWHEGRIALRTKILKLVKEKPSGDENDYYKLYLDIMEAMIESVAEEPREIKS